MSVRNIRGNSDGYDTEHITARVETRLIEALRRKATENDRSLSAELRQALRNYLRDEVAA
jgi:hypothetical protein